MFDFGDSSLERWRKKKDLGFEPERLRPEDDFNNNFGRAFGQMPLDSYEEGDSQRGRLANCQTAEDCGADHICTGGECVPSNSTGTGAGSTGSGGGSGFAACTDDPPEKTRNCEDKNCQPGPGCGDGSDELLNCCGDPIYTCQDGRRQCEPCDDSDGRECNDFCDSWFRSNGSVAPGCDDDDHCGECSECFASLCRPATGRANCFCFPGNSGCPDCQECSRPGGGCVKAKGACTIDCNCFVTCPCGSSFQGFHSQDYYDNGLACPAACRAATYQKYCVDGANQSCPPQKDPMKEDPGNKCEESCYGTSQKTPCNGTYTCPDGHSCTVTGKLFAATGEGGACEDGGNPTGAWSQGGITWFIRVCKLNQDDPDCEECDCNCENDCPDCHTCGPNGECVYDEACDQPCDVPCNGDCCGPGQTCVPAVLWQVIDACHFAGVTFAAPAGVTPELVHTDDITAAEAVCGRWHTHCNVVVNGSTVATHLDCQKGLRQVGPASFSICSG